MVKTNLTRVLRIIVAVAICFLILLGYVVPRDKDSYKKIGYYTLRPYKYGLYIGVNDSYNFYNFSPYNDFYINSDDKETHVLDYNKPYFSEESKSEKAATHIQRIIPSIKSYFGLQNPVATFKIGNKILVYRSEVHNKNLRISVDTSNWGDSYIKGFVMTLSFNDGDIIYDDTGKVYTDTALETIDMVNRVAKTTLKRSERPYSPNEVKTLFIYNPKTNGVIKVNDVPFEVDFAYRLIKFKSSENNRSISLALDDSL